MGFRLNGCVGSLSFISLTFIVYFGVILSMVGGMVDVAPRMSHTYEPRLQKTFLLNNSTKISFRRSSLKAVKRSGADCTCGMKIQKMKIVGGHLSKENAWPWLAPLVLATGASPQHFCGSTLIAPNYVLTAGHCVSDITVSELPNIRVHLGSNDVYAPDSVKSTVTQIIVHPRYNPKTLDNDIALIRLSQNVQLNERIQPICLQQEGNPFVGRIATVAGWGAQKSGGAPVNKLRQVNLKVIGNPECGKAYVPEDIKILKNMMCASLPKKDSCQGDSGGPLFIDNPSTKAFNQIGIVSFGRDCGNGKYPGVYTRVNRYLKWIKDNTKDATYCDGTF